MAVTRKRKAAAASPKSQTSASPAANPPSASKTKSTRVQYKDDDPFYDVFNELSDSAGESDVSDYEGRKRRKKTATKKSKKKSKKNDPGPEPEAPEISDNEYDTSDDESFSTTKQTPLNPIMSASANPGVLQIQIPALRSPTSLNLNLGDLLAQASMQLNLQSPKTVAMNLNQQDTTLPGKTEDTITGFLKLPKELRDKVYRNLFIAEGPIVFHTRDNFERSAQFLTTCRTVAAEGAVILYGENSFHFERTGEKRGSYHDNIWKEIGYKDVRRFLDDIGAANIKNLKYVSFKFEDASTYLTPYLDHAERAYVNDPVLLEIFRMFGENTILEKLAIMFSGRAQVASKDVHFLRALARFKCNKFHHATGYHDRIEDKALKNLKSAMIIKKVDAENIDEAKVKKVPMYYEKPKKDNFSKTW